MRGWMLLRYWRYCRCLSWSLVRSVLLGAPLVLLACPLFADPAAFSVSAVGTASSSERSVAEASARDDARGHLVCVGRLEDVQFSNESCLQRSSQYHCMCTARAVCRSGSTGGGSRQTPREVVSVGVRGAAGVIEQHFERQRQREEELERRAEEQERRREQQQRIEREERRRTEERDAALREQSRQKAREERLALEAIFATAPTRIPRDACGRDANMTKLLTPDVWRVACVKSDPRALECPSGSLREGNACRSNCDRYRALDGGPTGNGSRFLDVQTRLTWTKIVVSGKNDFAAASQACLRRQMRLATKAEADELRSVLRVCKDPWRVPGYRWWSWVSPTGGSGRPSYGPIADATAGGDLDEKDAKSDQRILVEGRVVLESDEVVCLR